MEHLVYTVMVIVAVAITIYLIMNRKETTPHKSGGGRGKEYNGKPNREEENPY